MRGATILVGLMIGLCVVAGCLMAPRSAIAPGLPAAGPPLRVLLLNDVPEVTLTVDGQARRIVASEVRAAMTFKSARGEPVTVNSKRDARDKGREMSYRGEVRLVPHGGAIDVVNVVSVEEYLLGVVTRESYDGWPIEALKAQAVAARTYALYDLRTRRNASDDRGFDVYDDTYSQAYGGVNGESDAARRAVAETSGQVLAHGPQGKERIFQAFFSSTCGGVTAGARDVFPEADVAPLQDHVSDGCGGTTMFAWSVTLPKKQWADRLRAWGKAKRQPIANLRALRTFEVADKNKHGRPTRYLLTDGSGTGYYLTAEQARSALGWDAPKASEVWSGFLAPTDLGEQLKFDGRGFGHGVGLCQWCTAGWAKRGMDCEAILRQSYPGAVVVRAY